MLVLGRHAGESLLIGEDITVTVLSVSGPQVRLGIEAPRDISIVRDELQQYSRADNELSVAD